MIEVELLYFDGCPSWHHAVRALEELAGEGVALRVRTVAVSSPEEAQRCAFPGSPTLRVRGADLFPHALGDSRPGAMGCRVYRTPDGLQGWPTKAQIAAALDRVATRG